MKKKYKTTPESLLLWAKISNPANLMLEKIRLLNSSQRIFFRLAITNLWRGLLYITFLSLLSACSTEYDLHGADPQAYYTTHPIINKVKTSHALLVIPFSGSSGNLSDATSKSLHNALNAINPHAVEEINLQTASGMPYKNQSINNIKKILRKFDYPTQVHVKTNEKVNDREIIIDITYAELLSPDCPDWKKSPVTTYSNMLPANFGCSTTVNLGLMVDNPRDLVRGRDSRKNNTEISNKAISDYRSGVASAASASATTSTASVTGQ